MTHVLIMDDEEDLLDMVSMGLTRFGLQTTCILEPSAFFSQVLHNEPDIILMDIYLTKADGRDICRQLKENKNFAHIPVVLYSAGNISDESIHSSLADGFVHKPFELKELSEKLLNLVSKK